MSMPNVLVVDDDTEQRAEFVRVIARVGYAVADASTGGEALQKALAERPDLVVLDLMLPDMHGAQVAGAIRAVAGSTRMPIVIVTAHSDALEQLDPKRFGAQCVLTKPVGDEQLLTAIEHCLASPPSESEGEQ
jgi:CheY-like chemotaxis protein